MSAGMAQKSPQTHRIAAPISWSAYGGSVTPDNVDDLIVQGRIDGFLVGGASLDSKKFLALAEAMKRLPAQP